MYYDQRDQVSSTSQTNVIGEIITLVGTTVVALANQHVTSGSVVINNATRTQTYGEGIDYVLSVVGFKTRVQRVVGGNILDGQSVLVDYSYDSGGTFAYNQTDRTLNISWSLLSYADVYYRRLDSDPRLTSGFPSFPLNTIVSNVIGAHAEIPLKLRTETSLGGGFEREDRHETIAPFRRASTDLYARTEDPFFSSGSVHARMRRSRVEYENSTQDVNLRGYDLRYLSRPWFGIDLIAYYNYDLDTGAEVPRRHVIGSVKGQWRYRKVSASLELQHSRESQGAVDRSRTLFQFLVRRDL